MEENGNVRFRDRSLDEFMGFLPPDVPGSGQLSQNRFPQSSGHPIPRLETVYPNENVNPAFMGRPNVFYHETYHQVHQREPVPFLMHPPPAPPGMIDLHGGDYFILGGDHQQKIHNGHNMSYMNKANETLTGLNNIRMEYPISNYNLFSGTSQMRYPPPPPPQMPQNADFVETNAKAQLIENLVGNWASDQSGTYSPFGTPLGGLKSEIIDNMNRDAGKKVSAPKAKIVAEVRPMGPSYSDVLAKSIAENGQKTNPKRPQVSQPVKQKNVSETVKAKPAKFTVGRTPTGNGNVVNRQPTPADTESNCLNESNSKRNCIKSEDQVRDSTTSKKWLTLDDLKSTAKRDAYINMNDVKNNSNAYPFIPVSGTRRKPRRKKWDYERSARKLFPFNGQSWIAITQARTDVDGVDLPPRLLYPKNKKKKNQNSQKEKVESKDSKGEMNGGGSSKQEASDSRTSEEKRVPWKVQSQKSSKRSSRNGPSEKHEKSVRTSRRDQDACISSIIKVHIERSGVVLLFALNWLVWLVLDVLCLSTYLAIHVCTTLWASSVMNVAQMYNKFCRSFKKMKLIQRIVNSRFYPFKKPVRYYQYRKQFRDEDDAGLKGKIHGGLKQNISLPDTGEEAIKRLLACKEKDAYYVLGVTRDCTDDDIKKYYKRQAFLVHPDKNKRTGAEEAFKTLTRAFNLIGTPNNRKTYNRRFETSKDRFDSFMVEVKRKREFMANYIWCTNCKASHRRTTVNRPLYAARMCGQCKIHHSVKEGDVWAETSMFGLLWNYYACMDGTVYDITEWAGCQGKNLKNIKANTHNIQYRVARGLKGPRHPLEGCGVEIDYECYEYLKNLIAKQNSRMNGMDSSSGKK